MIPRSYPPLGSRPIAETVSGRNLATSSAQPAVSLLTEKNHPSDSTTTSKRSFDTSIPQKESMAIFVSHPCCSGLVPWQLCGYGRSDWSTKLIRGLTSEAAAGFRSRRGPSHDSTTIREFSLHRPKRLVGPFEKALRYTNAVAIGRLHHDTPHPPCWP